MEKMDQQEIGETLGTLGAARRTTVKALALGSLALFAGKASITPAYAASGQVGCAQEGWRWCGKCEGMFYALASTGKGVCPFDHQPHTDSGSSHYYERYGEDAPGQQGGWRWCKKCAGLFYARATVPPGPKGICPKGGKHDDSASGHYAAIIGEDAYAMTDPQKQQGGWRWCHKCEGMFYARASAGKGSCPASGAHDDTGSGHYASLW